MLFWGSAEASVNGPADGSAEALVGDPTAASVFFSAVGSFLAICQDNRGDGDMTNHHQEDRQWYIEHASTGIRGGFCGIYVRLDIQTSKKQPQAPTRSSR